MTEPRQLTMAAEVERLSSGRTNPPSGYALRRTEPADRDALADLFLAAYSPQTAVDRAAANDEMERTFASEYGELDLDVSPVVSRDGIVVGAVMVVTTAPWSDVPPGPFVIEVMVHPSHRRKGLAESALDWMARRLVSSQKSTVALRVMSDNPAARSLYEKVGFRRWHGAA